ncbi:cysteine--1-D-myo-inosityl 2-amino-2-deoxy-alpha-D-glucopyranoside ligase [Propionibacterium freudenreichii]|uniref:L-cysteine:1D-myo-inositol 2-amino-2-deoxy-alpha-D-glucopyranoside ligase n=3 Tax=Propionibacterium TaxID=1743 RepID=D7GEF2_PROFC|nr:cysteine--1-D-myo-inosityl 2-amino-2-deoxy-alpha-D-glucopyranoside ligase [Propionibacterium freudenreichii]AJQ91045.1 L-cysteine:1D-myo-inositol 2-amino-2-deoxy-alpha-D-glucopyranoside ligase [Propionibacterium freudenreichii subsp. freudenreichii]MCQ1998514.1 cysteine--1-D-myo-inosityl 2-amino-2-deoxy-alpha-D-glucopyranoside ligase [Propionibacterium freudenreichii]MCT2974399.1 cysteine--1-D-myo-inosityl 2-amino-2-deoxy-alpha-D-glucopyranoside ligase [Propionibacterium freudenreichii]MCT29
MQAWPTVEVPTIPASPSDQKVPERLVMVTTNNRRAVPIGPADGDAGLYVCGITPYDATHMGHAFTYVMFDVLDRVWRDLGLNVRYAQNVTDVDDPLLERARATGVDWRELASDQTQLFRDDMESLRVLPPRWYVPATSIIDEVVELIERLRQQGTIYQVDDPQYPDWYFEVGKAPGFGTESHLSRQDMISEFAEHGGDPERPGKRDALDCLVWRMERPGEPAWDSRLGRGRPGWHIECTATALNRLGEDFAVQGGGRDLAFPHHEMCAAEAIVATGKPFAEAYIHVGMVGLDGEKMSKSLGNLVLVSKLRAQGVDPMAIRLALLAHGYASDWSWTQAGLDDAQRRLDAWRAATRASSGTDAVPVIADIRRALREGLDTPTALAVVDEWSSAVLAGDGDDLAAPQQISQAVDALLGIRL